MKTDDRKSGKTPGAIMKAIFCAFMAFASLLPATAEGSEPADTLDIDDSEEVVAELISKMPVFNASDAFLHLPADVLDLIPMDARLDMVDYAEADTVRPVTNSMGGESRLLKLSKDYALVEITPVSTLQIRLLPDSKGSCHTVVTVYTIGGADREAADSDIRFYNVYLDELPRDKFIRLPKLEDFFDLHHQPKETKKDLETLVPFPTMTIDISPDAPTLDARLSIGQFMDLESFDKLKPLMRQNLTFTWDGKKFKEDKTTTNTK